MGFTKVYAIPLRVRKCISASPRPTRGLLQAVRSFGQDVAGFIVVIPVIEFIEAQKGTLLNVYESLDSGRSDVKDGSGTGAHFGTEVPPQKIVNMLITI